MNTLLSLLFLIVLDFSWPASVPKTSQPGEQPVGYKLKVGAKVNGQRPLVIDVGNKLLLKGVDVADTYNEAVVTAYNSVGIESAESPANVFRPQAPDSPPAAAPAKQTP